MGFNKDPLNRSLFKWLQAETDGGLKEGAERSCARCQSERDARNEADGKEIARRRGWVGGRTYCESSCTLSRLAGIVLVGPNLTPRMGKLNTGGLLLCPLNRNLGRPGDQIRCSFALFVVGERTEFSSDPMVQDNYACHGRPPLASFSFVLA
ncbi:hypothetical protein PAHAL_5G519100 [Panicum hallii]|uniref:Uncharacterized protein n=1 Tax=Panicum hallii TaxID=206008 RepID=A0A2T8IP99_9POAL|nr:hypothetical protein PAHAL_5G519100 [Panicum hallii]